MAGAPAAPAAAASWPRQLLQRANQNSRGGPQAAPGLSRGITIDQASVTALPGRALKEMERESLLRPRRCRAERAAAGATTAAATRRAIRAAAERREGAMVWAGRGRGLGRGAAGAGKGWVAGGAGRGLLCRAGPPHTLAQPLAAQHARCQLPGAPAGLCRGQGCTCMLPDGGVRCGGMRQRWRCRRQGRPPAKRLPACSSRV